MIFNLILLQETAPQTGGSWSGLIMIAAIFVIFWLFFIRPQNKKQKEQQKFREALKAGDKVITIGGIHGKVKDVKEHTIVVTVGGDTAIEFEKSAIIPDASQVGQA